MNDISRSGFEAAKPVNPDPINPKIRAMEVIDTDFHFTPPWPVIRNYLAEPFKSRIWHYPAVGLEYNPEPANEKPGVGQDSHGTAGTGAEALRVLDQFGSDTVILNPGYNRPMSIFSEPVLAAFCAAHNDYMIKEVFPVSPRLKANMMVCQRNPEMAAAEIRRVGNHSQFVGVFTEFSALYEQIGNARFDPIFDAMRGQDLVLTAHSGGWFNHFSPMFNGARTWVELFGNAPIANAIVHLAAMIMQGLFDKYPKQKVLFQEGGVWWLSDFMLRVDEFYVSAPGDIALTERKLAAGERYLRKLPSEYIMENVRFSTQPITIPKNPKHFGWMLELCRAGDLFCFSTDWPHQTMDAGNWVVEHPGQINEEMQKAILAGNARKLYSRI